MKSKKLSEDVLVEETGGFIRLCYIENDGSTSNGIFLSEEETKNLNKFLEDFDYTNIRKTVGLRK